MTTTADLKFDNFAEMLTEVRAFIARAAGVEGAGDIGALLPIRKYGESRQMGEFSNLSEWLDDVADTLQDFLAEDGEELETWHAGA